MRSARLIFKAEITYLILAPTTAGSLAYITTVTYLYWSSKYELSARSTLQSITVQIFLYGSKRNSGVHVCDEQQYSYYHAASKAACYLYLYHPTHEKLFYNLPPQEHLFFSTVYHDKVNFSTSLTSFSQIFLWEGLFFNLRSPHILYRRFQAADNYLIVSAVFMFIPQISCALFIIRTYSAAMHSDSFRSRAGMNIL